MKKSKEFIVGCLLMLIGTLNFISYGGGQSPLSNFIGAISSNGLSIKGAAALSALFGIYSILLFIIGCYLVITETFGKKVDSLDKENQKFKESQNNKDKKDNEN